MRNFGEFLYDKYETFQVDDVLIIIEPVPMTVAERHIVGIDDNSHVGMTKYRVTFKWPRSKNKAKANTYDEEVRYVLAHNAKEARSRIEEFVRSRRNRNLAGTEIPADYLTNLSRSNMGIKTKSIESWNDFVKLCEFIAKKKPKNPIKYFDQNDLSIFINKYRRSADFGEQLQKLPKEVQLLMKRIYFHVINGDLSQDNHNQLHNNAKHSDIKTKDVLNNKAKSLGKFYPKPVIKDLNEDPPSLGSVADVIKMAKSYGFTYAELKSAKQFIDEHNIDPLHDDKIKAFRDIRSRIEHNNLKRLKSQNIGYRGKGGIGRSNSLWNNDEGGLDKFGGDTWVSELERDYPWLKSMGSGDSYAGVFELMRNGMPKKPVPLELWTKALEQLIDWKRQSNTTHSHDNIPF